MKEIWKNIKGYEGLYQISNHGRVKSLERKAKHSLSVSGFRKVKEKLLTVGTDANGYKVVSLTKNNITKRKYIHRLIAKAFIENHKKNPCINHIDGDKSNNSINNLEWCTKKENNQHAFKNNLIGTNGENSPHAKLTEKEVLEIRKLCNDGITQRKIAQMYDISQQHVSAINTRKWWSWL